MTQPALHRVRVLHWVALALVALAVVLIGPCKAHGEDRPGAAIAASHEASVAGVHGATEDAGGGGPAPAARSADRG